MILRKKILVKKILNILLLFFCIGQITACQHSFPRVYKIRVNQGNVVTPTVLSQLKPGMTRKQVLYVLGTPLGQDTFHPDRWDYLYEERKGAKIPKHFHLQVFFEADRYVRHIGTTPAEEAELFELPNQNR